MADWQIQLTLISLAIVLTAAFLAVNGWRRRTREQASLLDEPAMAPTEFGSLLEANRGDYVATTFADDYLNRVSAYGLGIRGKADFELFDNGLLILRHGERPLFIASAEMNSVERNQAVIDRAVERNGLLTIVHRGNLATHIRLATSEANERFFNLLKKEVTN
ncbi:hypothetical protein [Candidatus Rhodoluna planktonica]|uniref:PH domain-containing protein n=1 Tax=Candidatus Rhodoluna planktonica TaxID=535712 RepID=A0A1D9DZ33_9MICO|nr:hypothetical protein [Candidatus Rhodoluna planktonica]AOY56059.1 hypothetical protein A4Z71_03550 [Candidatus Rhodoluna planktonica]